MKKLAAAITTGVFALSLFAGPAGAVEPDRTVELNDTDKKTETYTSDAATGTGTAFFLDGTAPGVTYECTGDIDASCDYVLIAVTGFTDAEIAAAQLAGKPETDQVTVTFDIDNYAPVPVSDFDLQIFASDADGTKGEELGQSGNNPGDPETVTTSVKTTTDKPTGYVLVEVVHFAAVMTTYDAVVTAR